MQMRRRSQDENVGLAGEDQSTDATMLVRQLLTAVVRVPRSRERDTPLGSLVDRRGGGVNGADKLRRSTWTCTFLYRRLLRTRADPTVGG